MRLRTAHYKALDCSLLRNHKNFFQFILISRNSLSGRNLLRPTRQAIQYIRGKIGFCCVWSLKGQVWKKEREPMLHQPTSELVLTWVFFRVGFVMRKKVSCCFIPSFPPSFKRDLKSTARTEVAVQINWTGFLVQWQWELWQGYCYCSHNERA